MSFRGDRKQGPRLSKGVYARHNEFFSVGVPGNSDNTFKFGQFSLVPSQRRYQEDTVLGLPPLRKRWTARPATKRERYLE